MDMHELATYITDIPDYPEPGVVFKDITPLFADPDALAAAIHELAEHFKDCGVTKVVGPEARGLWWAFLWPLLWVLVLFRRASRASCRVRPSHRAMSLNTAPTRLRSMRMLLMPMTRFLLSTTLWQPAEPLLPVGKLVESTGATLVGFGSILELAFLNPRAVLETPEHEVWTLIKVD